MNKFFFSLALVANLATMSISAMERPPSPDEDADIKALAATIQSEPLEDEGNTVLAIGALSVLPPETHRKIISYSQSDLNLRLTCQGLKIWTNDCMQNELFNVRHPRLLKRSKTSAGETRSMADLFPKNEAYEKNPEAYLVSLKSLLASVEPRTISCYFVNFTPSEQQAVVSAPGLQCLKASHLRNDVIPFLSESLLGLIITDINFVNIGLFRKKDFTFPQLAFAHLTQLQSLDVSTKGGTEYFEFNMALLPVSLRTLHISNCCSSSSIVTQYRLSNCNSFRNLTSLQRLSFYPADRRLRAGCHLNNFSDLSVLPASIQVLDLRHCSNIQDFTPLQELKNLRRLIVMYGVNGQLPELAPSVDVSEVML